MSEELGAVQEQTFAGATGATADSYPPERRLPARQPSAYLDPRALPGVGSRPPPRPPPLAPARWPPARGHVLLRPAWPGLLAAHRGRVGARTQPACRAVDHHDRH